jgi:D-glycero-alpha-D-manno-heptose-7-phosphate kinase
MVIVRAPLRISFGGGGTDLMSYYASFGGFVVSTAITRYCHVVADDASDGSITLYSDDYDEWKKYPAGVIPPIEEPLILPKAVIAWFTDHGLRERGISLFLASDVLPGTGLGSSGAMTVALVRAMANYLDMPMSDSAVAELACYLEIERLGMPIGKQDQYASAYGGLNAIEFTSSSVTVTPLALPLDVISALNSRLLLFSTYQTHNSGAILRQLRSDTRTKPETLETLHSLKALAEKMQKALLAGDLDRFGRLLDRAWQEKGNLSKQISTTMIDHYYDAARKAGALGGKITGAGAGGFLLLYCPEHRQEAVRTALAQFGLQEMTFDFDFLGAQVLTTSLPSASLERAHAGQYTPAVKRGDYVR